MGFFYTRLYLIMAGYCDPPNKFSSTNQPTRRRGPSVIKYLNKLLKKKINYEDPETKLMLKGPIALVIALREILNACQGDQNAIEDIIDRVDGKTIQKVLNEGFGDTKIIIIRDGNKTENISGQISVLRSEIPSTDSGSGDGKDIIPSA